MTPHTWFNFFNFKQQKQSLSSSFKNSFSEKDFTYFQKNTCTREINKFTNEIRNSSFGSTFGRGFGFLIKVLSGSSNTRLLLLRWSNALI